MNFDLTEDRQMLSDSLNRFLADKCPFEHRTKVAYEAPYHDPALWAGLSELGALYAFGTEEQGGFGGSGFDITVVFEAMGRALCPEPLLGAAMGARLLAAAGADADDLMSGAVTYALAVGELDAPYDLDGIACAATKAGEGYTLTGRKSAVYGGQAADRLLVAATLDGALALFEVTAAEASVTGYGMIDGGGAAEVVLDATPGKLLLADARAALEDAQAAGIVALCAEAVGLMDVLHKMTVEYLGQRKQFGRTIGSFQALQHRAVDMLTEIEQARSITIKAAAELGGPDAGRYASMAKNLIGRAGRLVAEEAIQMHGGIAMTWEYPGAHYAKRIVMIDAQLGDTDYHLSRVMAA